MALQAGWMLPPFKVLQVIRVTAELAGTVATQVFQDIVVLVAIAAIQDRAYQVIRGTAE